MLEFRADAIYTVTTLLLVTGIEPVKYCKLQCVLLT